MSISREELSLIEKIASRVARGQTAQQIAIEADLDIYYVEKILSLPAFEEIFHNIDPSSYQKWKDNQADLRAKRLVMTLAQEDSVEYYKKVRDLVLNSQELRDKERIDAMFSLMKIAKIGEGEAAREVVELSKDNLETILEAWRETEKKQ